MSRRCLLFLVLMTMALITSLLFWNAVPAMLNYCASFSTGPGAVHGSTSSSSSMGQVANKEGVSLLAAAAKEAKGGGMLKSLVQQKEQQNAVEQSQEEAPSFSLPRRKEPDRPAWVVLPRRRLNNQREDCPANSLYHCDNPNTIMGDPDVACDIDTCEWDTSFLRPDREPTLCQSITITNVSALDDFLEPCLWWEMLYGDLTNKTIFPEDPEVEEVDDDKQVEEEEEPQQGSGGAGAGSGGGSTVSEVETTDWIKFETILLTFLVDSGSNPSSSSGPSTSSSANTSNDKQSEGRRGRFLRGRQRQTQRRRLLRQNLQVYRQDHRGLGQQRMDPDVLLQLTRAHVLKELERKLGSNDVTDVSLVITPVSASSSSSSSSLSGGSAGGLVSMSHAVNGKVKFNRRIEKQVESAGVVQHMVDQAFEGDAMDRFLDSLKGSDDPVMQRIEIVYKGLPSDLQDSDPTPPLSSSSSVGSFQWNDWWIFVVVGSAVGILAFCLSSSCLCYRYWTSRPYFAKKVSKVETVDPVKSNDDTAPADEPDEPDCNSDDSDKSKSAVEDPTDGIADRQRDDAPTPAGDPQVKNGDVSMEVSEIDDSESYLGRYQINDATSVYSYIDGHTTLLMEEDNQSSYSIAPSLMYDRVMPDDQSVQSRMWSVVDGITYDSHSRVAQSAAAPRRVLVIGGGKAAGATLEGGDDDDYSLVSEFNNPPEGNVTPEGGDLRVLEVVKRSGEMDQEPVVAPSKAPKKTPSHPSEELKPPPPPSQSLPYANMNRNDDDEESSSSDSSYGPSACDSSHSQKETAEVAVSTGVSPDIEIKKKLGSKGVSVRVRKSQENRLNNKAVLSALAESSASDDDSSLFMGPSDIGKGSSVIQLSAKDKVEPLLSSNDSERHDEFRFGPLRLGRRKLKTKGKELLHRGATGTESRNDGHQATAVPIPRELVSSSEEKKDDMSVSSIGSAEVSRVKVLMGSAASG